MTPPDRALRALLALLAAVRWLAPSSRRGDWHRQWRADVWHEWQWASRQPGARVRQASLIARVGGAVRHAFWLRLYVRRLEMISQDLRYGWRLMVRQPGFTAAAVLMLGLGIGASVTIFSWLQVAFQPLAGVPHADRLVMLHGTTRTRRDLSTSYPNLVDYRASRPDSVEDLIGQSVVPLNLSTDGNAERLYGLIVTGNYFDVLGVRPAVGRTFLPEEDRAPDQAPVVVFSHAFWQRRFNGDPAIVGRPVTLNGRPFTVVGIAPPGFRGTALHLSVDAWVPMMMQPAVLAGDRLRLRGNGWIQPIVKLKPGATLERAQLEMSDVARRVRAAVAAPGEGGVRLSEPWRSTTMTSAIVAVAAAQLGIALVVLLICCANVASLLLARAAARQKETAVRLSLGAGRLRLLQQVLVESTLLALAGGAAGVAVAWSSTGLIRSFLPPTPLPIALDPSLDRAALGFAIALTAVSVLVFGLVPALQGSSTSVVRAFKESAATTTSSRSRARWRRAIVTAQMALSVVLVVCSVLFLRTLRNAYEIDPGFSARSGLMAAIDLLPAGYDEARGAVYLRDLLARLRAIPGVEAASTSRRVPLGLGGTSDTSFEVEGYTPAAREEMSTQWNQVGSSYLRTMGIGLVEGRDLTEQDVAGGLAVAIVNETIARRYFAGRSAVGGRLALNGRTVQVVGIARDGKYGSITESPVNMLYIPVAQWYRPDATILIRTAGNPMAVLPDVQAQLRALDPTVPLFEVRTIAEHLETATFLQRMAAGLITGFGVVALLLAGMGLYGVIAGSVVQQLPEIGLRLALGARRRDIMALIVRQGARLTVAGIALGLVLAIVATRLLEDLLVGVSATDTWSYLATIAVLTLVAGVAAALPARRAASVDPIAALRRG